MGERERGGEDARAGGYKGERAQGHKDERAQGQEGHLCNVGRIAMSLSATGRKIVCGATFRIMCSKAAATIAHGPSCLRCSAKSLIAASSTYEATKVGEVGY